MFPGFTSLGNGGVFALTVPSPDIIRLAVLMHVRFPLSLRNAEDLLFEGGIDICHETVRFWWNRFGPMFAADIGRQRVSRMGGLRQWRWHLVGRQTYKVRRLVAVASWQSTIA